MDEKIVQLTESSLGRKLVPDTPVYPIVLDRSVLVMDKDENKYVPLDTLDLIGFMKLSEYFSKFIPFNQYVVGILKTSGTYEGATKGEVIYCTTKNAMLLKLIEHDNVLGDVAKYYTQWTGEQSILGYSSDEYNSNGAIRTSRFFYTVDTGLTFYKYSNDLHLLVPTATGSESIEPGYIEQVIDNIFNSYINTAAHIKPISYWIDNDMELPDFMAVEEGSYAYWEGHGLYVRLEELMDWDLVATDTIGQFFYYDNALYEWDGTNLMPVIDTAAVITSLHNEFNTIIENENEYIKTLTTWHHLYAYVPNDDEDIVMPMLDGGENLYIYRWGVMYHSEDQEWVEKSSTGDDNIDNHFFYNSQYLFQYRNNTLFVIFNFETMISNILPVHLENVLSNKTKTLNGLSLWKNDDENDNIEVPSIEYVRNYISNLINKNEFLQNSNDPASQKTIYDFVTNYIENEKGKILVPKYSCAENQLPVSRVVGAAWYDTANDQLYRITSDGYENYAAVGEAYLVYLRKIISNVATYDVILFVQTGARGSVAISLAGNGGSGNSGSSGGGNTTTSTNSIPFYTPIGWNDDRPGSGYPANSAFFNSATNRLYISSNVDVWGDAPAGSYLLHKSSTSEYYIFDQPAGGSAGVLTPLTVPDGTLSLNSKNCVQNKTVTSAVYELKGWRGRVIALDGEGPTSPADYTYWFNPIDNILKEKTSEGTKFYTSGAYILITPKKENTDQHIYIFDADNKIHFQLVRGELAGELRRYIQDRPTYDEVSNYITEAMGKVLPIKHWTPAGEYTGIDWTYGEYYYDSTNKKVWMMGDDGTPKKEIGKTGEAYILIDRTNPNALSYYLWNVGSIPTLILTGSDARAYATKDEFEKWRNRPIPVDYWEEDTPENPTDGQIWYKPSTKALTYREGGSWYDVLQDYSATSTCLLLNKNDNCLYIAPNNGTLLKYSSQSLENIYVNGDLVASREIDGKQAVELNIDPNVFDLEVNKGEVISPYWGELDENQTYLEGDYWLDDSSTPNKLKKYVIPTGETELDWVEITSGSYILRSEDSDGEHLYSFTVGETPTQLATYSEIENLTGGVTGLKIGTDTPRRPDANGIITIPPYVEPSNLANYATYSQLASVAGQIGGLNFNIGLASNHGKAIAISKEVDNQTTDSTTFSNYSSVDDFSLVMTKDGRLLLKTTQGNNIYYYSKWGPYHNTAQATKPEIVPNSECKTWDLYFQKDGTNYVFWTWDGSKFVKSPNLKELSLKADKSEISLLAKIINIDGVYPDDPTNPTITGVEGHYYVLGYPSNPYATLCKCTSGRIQPVQIAGLYVLCNKYEDKLYIYEEISGVTANYFVGIPTNNDYQTLRQTVPDWVKMVKHFGPSSSDSTTYSLGDLRYNSSSHLLEVFGGEQESFTEYESATSPLLLYNEDDTEDYPVGLYLYIRGDDVYPAGSTSGTPSTTTGSGAILIKYWQPGQPNDANIGDYWYDTNANTNKLTIYTGSTWSNSLIEQDALYVSPKPSEIGNETQKAYGNTIYRWDGSDLIALSNDDELTSTLVSLAETLQQQSASLSNIVATADSNFPTNAVIGQCFFKTGANNTGQPYWYAGGGNWVDANGDPYNS